ncbi:hypothetical protein FRC00_005197 [Tulasnella sp. 408]|nr:hypothetical protein FRC00_005197 [Tulasnella sp. 408]
MTITVHYLNNSRAQRILWLLEELEVPYNVVRYERVNMLAPPEFFKIHPLGKSPVITDGDLTIAESGAIVEYIITKYGRGKLQPSQSGWLDNLYSRMIDNRMAENRDLIEDHLKKHPGGWFAAGSEPTAADFLMIFPMEIFASHTRQQVPESFEAYIKMVHERPAYKRALEKGGSYVYAKS